MKRKTDIVQVNVRVRRDVRDSFKAKQKAKGKTVTEGIVRLMSKGESK